MVKRAKGEGAQIVLLPELFETPYFCQDQSAEHFALAQPFEGNTLIAEFASSGEGAFGRPSLELLRSARAMRITMRWP